MSEQSRIEIWLKKALELESRGYNFYLKAAEKALNPETRDFFKYLAEQELVHVEIIKKIRGRLGDEQCWESCESSPRTPPASVKQIFAKMAKNKPDPQDDIIKAVEGGMLFEAEAYDFYSQEIPKAGSEKEKKFLTLLAGEENEHRQNLADLKLYYSDPAAWAEQMDHILLDGA